MHLLGEFMAGPGKQYVVRLSAVSFDLTLPQFPIGMGTGAVYVTLSGLKSHSQALTTFETIFYFLNITLFLLNSVTLALQAIRASSVVHASGITNKAFSIAVYPRQAWRLLQDPVKGIFVPLIVRFSGFLRND